MYYVRQFHYIIEESHHNSGELFHSIDTSIYSQIKPNKIQASYKPYIQRGLTQMPKKYFLTVNILAQYLYYNI